MRMRTRSLAIGVCVLAAGCPAGDDGSGVGEASSAGEEGGDGGGGPTTTSSTGMIADSSGDTTGAPVPEMIPARDIAIDWVEANQGVGIPIGLDGAWVGPQERVARLLQGRITLVRAFWTISPDWQPREIEAHLLLDWPDGTTDRLVQTKLVEAETFIGDLDRVFYWGIEAERALPGLNYAIELYEHDPAFAEGAPDAPPYFPSEGHPVLVGIEDSYQLIKVTVVPFNYDDGANCVTQPDTSEETMQLFHELLHMQNPVDRIDFTLHEPIDWNEPLSSFGELNSFMSELRMDEGAPPEMYYYGLVDVCAGGLGGAGGQAFGIPGEPTMDAAFMRVSSGLSLDPDWSAETFVHEVGHSQGRRHVACDGEGGPDVSYPHHPTGDVGEWGFGVIDFKLRHPTVHKDYMTYCHPTWVGTWGWNKVQPFIETLSTWDADFPGNGAPKGPGVGTYSGSLLVGTITGSGKELWITVPGGLGGHEPLSDTAIELHYGEHRTVRQPATVSMLPDSADVQIVAAIPPDFADATRITRISGGRSHDIERTAIREHHQRR